MVCEKSKKVESDIFENTSYLGATYRFTSKELDPETGLYYYGARYLNPRTSRWISSDPAGFELINPMKESGKPKESFHFIESQNWYSYVSNNPVKYIDPTGMSTLIITVGAIAIQAWKNNYFEGLEKNYLPKQNNVKITNIMDFIKVDESGKPYTDKNGAAIFNDKGNEILGSDGWRIEAKDVFHEENGDSVVKLLHDEGGEQIYNMMTGDLVENQEFGGTFNNYPGPYDDKKQYNGHRDKDVIPWLSFGGGQDDKSSEVKRFQRLFNAKDNEYGSEYRNLEANE